MVRAIVSSEARHPDRFTLHAYRPRDSNPDHPRSERGASTVGLGRLGADGGSRTRGPSPRQGDALPTELHPHGACPGNRTPTAALPRRGAAVITKQARAGEGGFEPPQRESKSRGLPVSRFPIRAAPRCRPGPSALQGRSRSRARRQSTLAGIRTRINLALNQARLPCCGTSAQSRHPVPTRISCLTRARSQPCVTATLPDKDSNPDSRAQNPLSCH